MVNSAATEVLEFWREAGPSKWWRKDLEFDDEIRSRFGETHKKAASGEIDSWREESKSCLALILILDQFSRNLLRGSANSFAQDAHALEIAKHAVSNRYDQSENEDLAIFFYLPYMHSEDLKNQELCVELIRASGNESSLEAAIEHRDIIARFGRFPHRNIVLGRTTSEEEQAFLDDGGFSG